MDGTATLPTVGVVSLSQGTRPDDLARGLASLAAQVGVELDTVVVGNGWEPSGLAVRRARLALPQNVGFRRAATAVRRW
jgi:hypothetical protein